MCSKSRLVFALNTQHDALDKPFPRAVRAPQPTLTILKYFRLLRGIQDVLVVTHTEERRVIREED